MKMYSPFIPKNVHEAFPLSPDLSLLRQPEIQASLPVQTPDKKSNKLDAIYLCGFFSAVTVFGISLWSLLPQLNPSSQNIQEGFRADYITIMHY